MKINFLKMTTLSILLTSLILTCVSCKDTTKGGGVEPPASELDKIVIKEFANNEYQFEEGSIVKEGLKQISPKLGDSFGQPYTLSLAKNGDLWFYNLQCLFVSNIKSESGQSSCALPMQKMATDYIDSSIAGVYKFSSFQGSKIIQKPDDENNYWAIFSYYVYKDTKEEIGVKGYGIMLKFDSQEGDFKPIFQFPADPFPFEINIGTSSDTLVYNLFSSYFDLEPKGLYYTIRIVKDGKFKDYLVRYDLSNDKHYLQVAADNFNSVYGCSKNKEKCYYLDLQLINNDGQCTKQKDGKSVDEVKKEVANCLNDLLASNNDKVIEITRTDIDITSYLTSKEEAMKLYDFELTPQKELALISSSKLKYFDPNDEMIKCNVTECFYSTSVSNIVYWYIDHYFGKENLYFTGETAVDGKISKVLYRLNLANGDISLISTGLDPIYITIEGFAPDSNGLGDVLLLEMFVQGSDNNTLLIYSSKTDKVFQLPFNENQLVMNTAFPQIFNDRFLYSYYITLDGKKGFFNIKNKETSEDHTYYLDIEKLINLDMNVEDVSEILALANPDAEGTFPIFYWKGIMFWKTSLDNNILVNKFLGDIKDEEDRKLSIYSEADGSIDIAGTITSSPAPEIAGFDISVNLGDILKCGGGTENSLYCPGSEMCKNGSCISVDTTECSAHLDCGDNNICQSGHCVVKLCSYGCPIGSKCNDAGTQCTATPNADECFEDSQCASPGLDLICKIDNGLGYQTCQAEVTTCVADANCGDGQGFICVSLICIPKMTGTISAPPSTSKSTSETGYRIYQNLSWNYAKDTEDNNIENYTIKVTHPNIPGIPSPLMLDETEDVTGNSKTVTMFIPGGETSMDVDVSVWPNIIDLTPAQIDAVKIAGQVTLTNDDHCMLEAADTNKCPSVFGISLQYKYVCENNTCVKKPITPIFPGEPILPGGLF